MGKYPEGKRYFQIFAKDLRSQKREQMTGVGCESRMMKNAHYKACTEHEFFFLNFNT